jgi:hypothetical protein
MLIAIDYDDTYTADVQLFKRFTAIAQSLGHTVVIVTGRDEERGEPENTPQEVRVFMTQKAAKRPYMEALGFKVDIWIDDTPESVCMPSLAAYNRRFFGY